MKNTIETRLGIFVVLAAIAGIIIIEIIGGLERFQRGVHVSALFNTAQDLKEGDPVKMAGVEIGRVEDITLDETNNKVRVEMKLRPEAMVRASSVATIKFTGLMGQNFVSLDFGAANSPLVRDGTVLSTAEQPDLSAMMAKLDNVATGVENITKSFSGVNIDELLGPLLGFIKDNREPLTATIANMQAVSRQVAEGKGTIGTLIYDKSFYNSAYTAVTNFQDVSAQMKATFADARKVVDQVNAGEGTIGKLLHDETLYRETTTSMTTLREILQKINEGQGSMGKLVNDQDLYKNAKMTLQKLDKATEGLEDQGPLSVMGILVNKLF
jgi:phospholipid/cholesterol/gamma-HCH transport system substrate-binding protein